LYTQTYNYAAQCFISGERKRLKPGAYPKLFLKDPEKTSERSSRAEKRAKVRHMPQKKIKVSNADSNNALHCNDIGQEVEVVSTQEEIIDPVPVPVPIPMAIKSTASQCSAPSNWSKTFSIHDFASNPKTIKYYTSFDDYDHFMFFFNVLGPATSHLGIAHVSTQPEDQFFLTVMKLRQAKDDFELSILFNIRPQTVSSIFTTWINFLYFQLGEINIWPSHEVVKRHMPSHFGQMFPGTRVILDATETPIQKPRASGPQRETFSSYKNKNTLKVMVGCTPRGTVSYISDAYGGSASDRQIIERSKLCAEKSRFEKGDHIMADRGIMVQDLFASKNVYVNTPTMLKGKSQLDPEEIHKDRKVASKRIHIERVIGLAKTYKILKKDLNSYCITLGNRIIHVCFYLCNFRQSIVKKNA